MLKLLLTQLSLNNGVLSLISTWLLCVIFFRQLFTGYIRFLSQYLHEKSPGTTALIWDDMLRTFKPLQWNNIFFSNNVEPVYWDYTPGFNASYLNLFHYHSKFKGVWIASAFKGADGHAATLPNMRHRFMNHFQWMNLILSDKFGDGSTILNFQGIILTGWSRYSHMDPLCELLPVAIPSLILNLLLIKQFKSGIIRKEESAGIDDFFAKYISDDCNNSLKCIRGIDAHNYEPTNCDFESKELFNVLRQYELVTDNIATGLDSGILSSFEYYASKKFVNINHLIEYINWCNNTLNQLVNVEIMLNQTMKQYYENEVIDEYVNYKTFSGKKRLKAVLKLLKDCLPTRVGEGTRFAANVSGLLD